MAAGSGCGGTMVSAGGEPGGGVDGTPANAATGLGALSCASFCTSPSHPVLLHELALHAVAGMTRAAGTMNVSVVSSYCTPSGRAPVSTGAGRPAIMGIHRGIGRVVPGATTARRAAGG